MWRQPWVMYKIRCLICGNNKRGTFNRIMIDVLSADQRTVIHIPRPNLYVCGRCGNEIFWRPKVEDVVDPLERI